MTLVDRLGAVGVSVGKSDGSRTGSGRLGITTGLLGGVTNVGDAGELGFIVSPALGDEGGVIEPGFIMSPVLDVGDVGVNKLGFIVSPASGIVG